jgi:geranylgeranylglycerol-phosphate geranylgeranyltransferase
MRAYLFFLSGMAGFAGVVWAGGAPVFNAAIIFAVVFIGWGVNQVINDILGLEEDRINAPHRALVTGALPLKAAVWISAALFVMGLVATAYLSVQAIWLYLAVFGLNILYEYAKAVPLLGNVVFGLLMPLTFYYGFQCASGEPLMDVFSNQVLFRVALGLFMINFSMCFFTYYKDYEGDKAVGKRTLVVFLTPEKARYTNFVFSLLPFLVMFGLPFDVHAGFIVCMCLNFAIFQNMALAYFDHPSGGKTYYNLAMNYVCAVLYEASFIVLVEPMLGVIVYILGYFGVKKIFQLHRNYLS